MRKFGTHLHYYMLEFQELVKFATYIIRQFIKVSETNNKVYMETLFWKSKGEAYEIEHGYGEGPGKSESV